jgi:arabinose-5-phosphate isomerase
MRTGDALAIVPETAPLRDALFAITKAGAGAACIVNADGVMVGLVTDGDIRRRLLQDETALSRPVSEAMTRNPITLRGNPLAIEVLERFHRAPRQNRRPARAGRRGQTRRHDCAKRPAARRDRVSLCTRN